MIALGVKNPYLNSSVDDTATLPAGHVPELHSDALAKCQAALDQTRHTREKIGLLIRGETGSGKSHLIAQLRQHLSHDPRAVLVCVTLYEAFSGRLWRHVRKRLMRELLRGYANAAHGANGLLRILRNRFPRWAESAQGAHGGLLDWLIGRSQASGDLQPHIEELARTYDLDYGLCKVLPKLATPQTTSLAHSWLKGEQLGPDDVGQLGLPSTSLNDLEQENQAKDVVLSFLRLAGDQTTLFLCFDQVETLQTGAADPTALRQFVTLATAILAEAGPRVVATFVRPTTMIALQKAVELADVRKLAQMWGEVPFLTWEQARRVVCARLSAEPTCQVERQKHLNDPTWPPGTLFLERLYREYGKILTPRLLIQQCSREFDRLQKSSPAEPSPALPSQPPDPPTGCGPHGKTPPKPPVRPDHFYRLWEDLRNKRVARIQGIPFDTVMAKGVPWLVSLTEAPYVALQDQDKQLGDVNLRFQPTAGRGEPVGISLCNQQPRLVWHRLDRLMAQWSRAKGRDLGSLVILRASTERTTEAAERRLQALHQAGARVVRVARQQLAELAAFYTMLAGALDGNMTRSDGVPIEATEYESWAKGHLSEAVKELFDQIFCDLTPADGGRVKGVSTPTAPGGRTKATTRK